MQNWGSRPGLFNEQTLFREGCPDTEVIAHARSGEFHGRHNGVCTQKLTFKPGDVLDPIQLPTATTTPMPQLVVATDCRNTPSCCWQQHVYMIQHQITLVLTQHLCRNHVVLAHVVTRLRSRIKYVDAHATKAYRGSTGIPPLILNFDDRWSGQIHGPAALPW